MRRKDRGGRPKSRGELARWYAEALEHQATSGLTLAEYAEEIGVAPATLYEWRRRLSAEDAAEGQRAAPFGLVEVTVEDEGATGSSAAFLVRLGGERGIEVPPGFAEADLRRLVRVLESC